MKNLSSAPEQPMTVARRSYLETLTREAGEDLPEDIEQMRNIGNVAQIVEGKLQTTRK